MSRHLIVLSCDENFFPLVKGLVLSVQERCAGAPELALVDIGLEPASRRWLEGRGVEIGTFALDGNYDAIVADKPYRLAQLCRPLLPDIFPGRDVYTWIDSDIWIQNGDVVEHHFQLAGRFRDKVVLSPCIDSTYPSIFKIPHDIVGALFRIYCIALGDREQANHYAFRPILSSGLFSMAADNPLWGQWKAAMDQFFAKSYQRDDDLHGLEQSALNYVVYKHDAAVLLDATYNYQCHERMPYRDEATGEVRVAMPPNRVIGAVHLTATGYYMRQYLERGLLFDRGAYLEPDERQRLEAMGRHYQIGA